MALDGRRTETLHALAALRSHVPGFEGAKLRNFGMQASYPTLAKISNFGKVIQLWHASYPASPLTPGGCP